jgi:hypothetical protein
VAERKLQNEDQEGARSVADLGEGGVFANEDSTRTRIQRWQGRGGGGLIGTREQDGLGRIGLQSNSPDDAHYEVAVRVGATPRLRCC